MVRKSDKSRLELLGSAGTAMALFIAGSAFGPQIAAAATTDSSGAAATANKTAVSQTDSSAAVSAIIDDADGGVVTDATSGTSTTNTVTGNDILAGATGNAFQNQIDLSTVTGSDGAAALGIATNQSAAPISSSVTNNDVSVDLTNFSNGSAVNDENTISATTTANKGSTLLTGPLANVFSATAPGSADASRTTILGTGSTASGGLIASTHQSSIDPANTATAGGNVIATRIDSTADNTVTSSPSVSSNAIAASVTGNSSQSTIDIASDATPLYAGSATVSNLQESAGAGTSSALNGGSQISGEVSSAGLPVNTLTGALTLENNTISSAASNNVALGSGGQPGNQILIDDAMSFSGSGVLIPGFSASRTGSDYSVGSAADLAVQNVQTVTGDAIDERIVTTAQTSGSDVLGNAEALTGGSVSVSGNAITATAQSNAASSRIASGENAASFAGTAVVGNLQDNISADIQASNTSGTIRGVVDEGFNTSTVASDGNAVRASAYGNQVSQSVDLDATTLALGSGEASLGSGLSNAFATASVAIGNMQTNTDTTVSATQSSDISVDWFANNDSSMIGSALSASGNTQEAVAVGSSAGNSLSLAGTTVGTGAGITNFQMSDATSSVEATSADSQVGSFARDGITDSEATVSNNLQRSIAYGASSGNTLAVTGTTLTLAYSSPASATQFDPIGLGLVETQVQSAYGVMNRQDQAGDVTATAATQTAYENRVEGVVVNGALETDGNSFVAAAYGTDAQSSASIDANSIDTGTTGGTEFASVAAVNNTQTVSGADILARAAGENVVLSDVYGDAISTSVSTSANTVQALAFGNRSTGNSVDVNATNIDTAVDLLPARGSAEYDALAIAGNVDASFAAQNLQISSGSVTASLLTGDIDPTSAQIRTQIGDSITGTSVVSDDNMSAAGATGNRASTSVALDGNQLATTAGVQNIQLTSSDLSALIGIAGTAGSPGDPGTPSTPVSASGGSLDGTMSLSGDTLTVSGSSVTVNFTGYTLTADEAAYLNSLTNVSGATTGGSSVTFAVGAIDTTVFNNFIFNSGADGSASGDETFTVSGFTIPGTPPTPATLATPNQGGVTVAIGDDVIGSSVSVAGNSTSGSVLGNSANNTITASATDLSVGSGQTTSTAADLNATGDLALSNVQSDTAATEASSVYGTFAIDATAGDISGSSLTVSNNSQRSDAGSNLATNTLAVSATEMNAGSALSSSQQSAAAVSALSDLDVFAPGASTQSATTMNENVNTARAVVNDATNTASISAANVDPVSAPNLVANPTLLSLTADHAMVNAQTATGSAFSTASSEIYNGDAAELATSGLESGSIEIAGNATTAQSVANLAANSMSVEGTANQDASAGINNVQNSSAGVTANATTTAIVTLAGDATAIPETAAANDASIRIGNNATTAVARGNSASNVLNMEAGATYGTAGAGTPGVDYGAGGVTSAFAATGGVLNHQINTGTVSANSTGVTYRVALNGAGGSPTVTGSSLSVSGNAVNAEAYGNTSSNRVVMTALNTGTPSAAIGNYQSNSAGVTATVTSVGYGVAAASGVIGGSTFSTTGNQVAATAVGNNAVSIIAAGN